MAEIEEIQLELGIHAPFIVENGGAICIPRGYFGPSHAHTIIGDFEIEYLGSAYDDILKSLSEVKERTDFRFKGFSEMSLEEIMSLTELPRSRAEKARSRLCSEPLVWNDSEEALQKFQKRLKKKGMKLLKGGRFYHLMGNTDKGKAVSRLLELFRNEYPNDQFQTIGIGDSPNDIEMLNQVNIPVLVQRPDGSYIEAPIRKAAILADGKGPVGWNKAITEILARN